MSTNERQTRRQELIAELRQWADELPLRYAKTMTAAADYLQGQEDAAQNILRRFEERRAEGGQ
jgi:hypothetical protein